MENANLSWRAVPKTQNASYCAQGVALDGTWTVDAMIQTPFPNSGHTAWHTLVRGQNEDHPVLLWHQDEGASPWPVTWHGMAWHGDSMAWHGMAV